MNISIIKEEINKILPFTEKEFEAIAVKSKQINLKKKEIWENEGVIAQNMGFVNHGMLRSYKLKDGNEFTDQFFSEREFMGNYISFLSQQASESSTVAMEACELIVLPFAELQKLYSSYSKLEEFSRIIGDQKLFELKSRTDSLLMDTPEERYYQLMEQKPNLFTRVPQYLIAQYLGIRPESLSRIRKRHNS